ncbi:hypothetical protein [Hymenobacter jeollabukensis]|uniref:Uncharacterized protein n=1 Tax=Hymenobacter jeollabukensis TaxID=2025313 RepID=A0A5R8WPV0_9BACT|nr:hypothetical protein [Hymenobacter jeollabukensis]TLM91762.1 hypothetical protein FDY95_14470 [Hymenobacter jeollabukensis]
MLHKYVLLATLGLQAVTLRAQTEDGPAPQPVQTITLDPQTGLSAAVSLPNRTTVVFMVSTATPQVHAVGLGADGRTLWQKDLPRYQQTAGYYDSPRLPRYNVIGPGKDEEFRRQQASVQLEPMDVFTDGNEVYTVEAIRLGVAKKLLAANGLSENSVVVQRLGGGGELTRVVFEAPPRKTAVRTLGRYAEGGAYVELVREEGKGDAQAFYTERYDLQTRAIQRTPLTLPETPAAAARVYNDWAYLGHRPNQTYLFRRVGSKNREAFGRQPLEYQVLTLDNAGAATGGFTTTLALPKGSSPVYSAGLMPSLLEQTHVPRAITVAHQSNFDPLKRYDETLDEWNISTGIFGDFYLDYATGDVLLFGEYGPYALPTLARGATRQGSFIYRFGPDGKLQQQGLHAYSKEEIKAQDQANEGMWQNRRLHFLYDPFTQAPVLSFAGDGGYASLYYDQDLAFQRSGLLLRKASQQILVTNVKFASGSWVYKPWQGNRPETKSFGPGEATGAPVYAQLAALRRAAGAPYPYHQLFVSAFADRSALVLEQPQVLGGAVRVYALKP